MTPVIDIQRAGGYFKARFRGNKNFVFGTSPQDARQKLLDSPANIWRDNSAFRIDNLVRRFRV